MLPAALSPANQVSATPRKAADILPASTAFSVE